MDAAFATHGINRHDVAVMELRRGMNFIVKSLQMLGVECRGEGQHLQGHAPAQGKLQGLVNNPHATPADFVHNLKVAEGVGFD